MSPTVVVDGGGQVRLVVGASGGSRIPSAVAQVAARVLWFGYTIKEAIDDRRVYVGTSLDEELYEEEMPRVRKGGTKECRIGMQVKDGIVSRGCTDFARPSVIWNHNIDMKANQILTML